MSQVEAILHLARILGRDDFFARLGLPEGHTPSRLTPAQIAAVQELAGERLADIVRALLEEAAACDDVTDAASAVAYLEDRLAFFGGLLSEEQRERIRRDFRRLTALWE